MLFLGGLFGYLVVLIILKWCIDWSTMSIDPPSLINVFMGVFLSFGNIPPSLNIYAGQSIVQTLLIVFGILAIPWMLFPKPFLLRYLHNKKAGHAKFHDEESQSQHSDESHGGHGEFDFVEIFMHQIIHTIEFVLGAISNTASYLRLWALSLAHSQLSKVFWTLLFVNGIQAGFIGAVIGFTAWFLATMGVIMVMESLSSFLHALRLHWVEFQNKFYDGTGIKFMPFSFQKILKQTD